jgi:hypothetical protein
MQFKAYKHTTFSCLFLTTDAVIQNKPHEHPIHAGDQNIKEEKKYEGVFKSFQTES